MAKSENICNASDSMAVMDYSHGCHGLFSMSYILHPQVKSKSLCSEKFGMRQTHLGQTETEVVTKYYLLASRTINLTLHRKYHSSDQLSQTISFLKPRSTYNYAPGRLLQPWPKGLPQQEAKHISPEQETCPLLCGNDTSTLLLSRVLPRNEKWPSPALHSWHLLERQVSTQMCAQISSIFTPPVALACPLDR